MPDDDVGTVTEDRLIGGRVRLFQPAKGYRAAIDPVFLAAALEVGAGETVLDLGCGVGAAGLCLLARQPLARITGLEVQAEMAALARRNASANAHDSQRLRVFDGSALAPPPEIVAARFDHVMTNPPFQPPGRGTAPPEGSKALAHVESACDLSAWVKAAVRLLAPKGRLWIIHRADRLGEVLAAFAGRGLGEVKVLPLWPKPGRPAGRVIVVARKGSRSPFVLLPGLVLHHDDGSFTPAAEAVLRDAGAIGWDR